MNSSGFVSPSLHRQLRSKAMTSPTNCRSQESARTTRACTNVASRTLTTESSRNTRLKLTWQSTPQSDPAIEPLRKARHCTWLIRNPARAARLWARTPMVWAQTRGPSPLLPLSRQTPKQLNTAQGQVRHTYSIVPTPKGLFLFLPTLTWSPIKTSLKCLKIAVLW